MVEIVDQLKNQTTWFVYNAGAAGGQQVARYEQNGVNASGYQSATLVSLGGTSGVTYAPMANQLYQWVDTTTLTRSSTADVNAYGWTFSGVSANSPTYPYTRTTSLQTGAQADNFREVVSAAGSYHEIVYNTGNKCCGTDFGGDWHQQVYDNLTLTLTNTVKASYPINITFNGGGLSTVNVTSNASIVLNGPINNLQGTTSVTTNTANASITVAPGANNPLVSGTTVTLTAPGGIGALDRPVPVQVYGGALTATSTDRDIAIASVGSLTINQVKVNAAYTNPVTHNPEPQGNVFISATGDINSASAYNVNNPTVVGKSIEINTSGGAIGAASGVDGNGLSVLNSINPLVIQAWATTFAQRCNRRRPSQQHLGDRRLSHSAAGRLSPRLPHPAAAG